MIKYQKIIIIGCPGSGKSTLSIKLSKVLNLPLYHMDNLYWKSDKTTISTEELKDKLHHICQKDAWIIDGNYLSTLSLRLAYHPLIIFLDYDTNLCLSSVIERIEKKRVDIPWIETEIDPEFMQFIARFNIEQKPMIETLIKNHTVIRFTSRKQCDQWLTSLDDSIVNL